MEDLAVAIVQVVESEKIYERCVSYVDEVSRKFYIEIVAQNYLQVYQKILKHDGWADLSDEIDTVEGDWV